MKAIRELFNRWKCVYWKGSKEKKGAVLDNVCSSSKLHRKAAIRKFSRLKGRVQKGERRAGRPERYGADVNAALFSVWEVGAHCCAELLIGEIDAYIASLRALDEWKHSDAAEHLLRTLSLGEMKRRIRAMREKHRIRGRTSTTPSTIRRRVKVYAGPWRKRPPGHRQFDSVVHCGDKLQGDMVYTINGVDPALLWSNRRAQWNKGEEATLASVEYIESHMPSNTLSRHADSGSEFLNFYFLDKTERAQIGMTRSRVGKKNDNAFVEERNNNVVRKWVGYERYDTPLHVDAMNALYEKLDCYLNHFQASRRCVKRERIGSKYVRVYDTPQTPYARALAHKNVSNDAKQKLRDEHALLNPVTLLKEIAILKTRLANVTRRRA
jgi:hypothetical protein